MKKISLFPFLFLCLVAGFALIAMADETLFEDIGASGYIKGGSGVLFSPAATTGTSTNNALTQIHAGTTGLWNSASSAGFWRFGRLEITENATDIRLGDTNIFNLGNWSMSFPRTATDDLQLKVDSGGRFKVTHGLNDTIMMTTNMFRFFAGTNEWITGTMGDNNLLINGRDGRNANSLIVSNYGSFFNGAQMVSSNFQQSVGSAGGFVGNGSGLTNLPGSAVAGFTPGSAIFAGATGALSQDNANYFWDITNRRLGVGLNTGLLAKVHAVATNGVVFTYMGDSYSSAPADDAAGFIGRRARGTVALPTAVTTGDILARFSGRGYGTTGFGNLGRGIIEVEAAETFTDTAQGGRLVFYTTPVTTTNIVEAMRIHNDGSVGIGTNTIVAATKLYVSDSIGASASIYAGGSPLISATNTFVGVSVGGVTGDLGAIYCTNVVADFPSTLTLAGADISFPVPASVITNMVVNIGRPSTEITGLVTVGYISSNGFVTVRSRNATAGTIDQGALPYTIHVMKVPTLNTLP